jgi:hypothetical protein
MIVTVNIHTQFTSFHRQITLSKREPSSLACGNLIRMTIHSVIGVSKAHLMAHGPLTAPMVHHQKVKRRPAHRNIQKFAVCLVCVIPDSDPGSHLSRDTFGLALPALYFLLWQKEVKTIGRNNHSALRT